MLPCGVRLARALLALLRSYLLLGGFLADFAAAGVEASWAVFTLRGLPLKIWSQPWENFWLEPVWTV